MGKAYTVSSLRMRRELGKAYTDTAYSLSVALGSELHRMQKSVNLPKPLPGKPGHYVTIPEPVP